MKGPPPESVLEAWSLQVTALHAIAPSTHTPCLHPSPCPRPTRASATGHVRTLPAYLVPATCSPLNKLTRYLKSYMHDIVCLANTPNIIINKCMRTLMRSQSVLRQHFLFRWSVLRRKLVLFTDTQKEFAEYNWFVETCIKAPSFALATLGRN